MWGCCPQETIVILFEETTPLLCLLAWLARLACLLACLLLMLVRDFAVSQALADVPVTQKSPQEPEITQIQRQIPRSLDPLSDIMIRCDPCY